MNALGVFQLSTTLRGTLSGTIKNAAGTTLAGITVTAKVDGGGQGQLTTTSGVDGSFSFTGLDVGLGRPYSLSFSDPSATYLPLTYDAQPATPDTAEMVRVVAGQTTTADAVLRRPAVLTGTVRNTAGAALPGITVRARLNGSAQGQITTTTAANGSYAFPGVDITADRLYAVDFSDATGAYFALDYDADPATPASAEMVKMAAGGTTTADAVLRRSCTLSGVVTDSRTGQPVAGVQVAPVLAPGQPAQTLSAITGGVTSAAGAYKVTGIPEGVYVVACQGKAPVYGMQYWPAAGTAESATQIKLGPGPAPESASATADVVLHHDDTPPATAALNSVKMRAGGTAKLKFSVSDAYGQKATLTLVIATAKGKVKARVKLGVRTINIADSTKWRSGSLAAGKYAWWVTATDLAGNAQTSIVKKSLTLTR